MKSPCRQIIPTVIGLVLLSVAALAQADLLTGQDSVTDMKIGVFSSSGSGNQDTVRQYDGRRFDLLQIQRLDSYGYNGDVQYWFKVRDLFGGNESVLFNLNDRNSFGFTVGTDALTARQARTPAINPYLAPFGMSSVTGGVPHGDAFLDLSPNGMFEVKRRVNQASGNITPPQASWLRITGGFWQQTKKGDEQLLFRSRAADPGVIPNSTRGAAAIPVDNNTIQGSVGTDIKVGKQSVVNYQFVNTTYNDGGTRPGGVLATVFPLNALTQLKSTSNANIIKASTRISKRLFFTGVHINRVRTDNSGSVPPAAYGTSYNDPGAFLGHKLDTETTNVALTYLATDSLTLEGRWRTYQQDDVTSAVTGLGGAVAANTPLSRNTDSYVISGSFTGIRHAFIDAGFEQKDESLGESLSSLGEDMGVPLLNTSVKNSIVHAGFRYYPVTRLSLSGKYEQWFITDPLFNGVPNGQTSWNFNTTYLVRDNFSLFGNYNSMDQTNDELRESLSNPLLAGINVTPTDPTTIANILTDRTLAAGQGFKNNITNWDIGAWYGINSKLSLDAYFGRITTNENALDIIGDSISRFAGVPLLPADSAPSFTLSDQWSLGLNYAITKKWRTHVQFLDTISTGQSDYSVIPGSPALPMGWQPVDITATTWTAGFDYQICRTSRLVLDYSVSNWTDQIDPGDDGRFNLWNLAWTAQFD